MKRMLITVAIFAVSAGATAQTITPATAMPPASGAARLERGLQTLRDRFASANTTHDGKLTRQQAAAGMPMVARHFDEIDTQHAGFLTLAQIEAYFGKKALSR
ncbi:EF-hand domain-containing protein [Trinickia acidisoli]|uniref:EF-hand domain-containing protein n=1 Tax=Trinickia acidisoli TaxID=2767482 RepID=UPI001A8EFB87|nr:EF-hand domain-containing protein [Trinickia acidisoli]